MMAKSAAPLTVRVIEAAPMLELLDPKRITVKNIRDAQPSKQLVDSVKKHGLLQPIGVLRTPEGELVLRFGGRRRLACIETGQKALAIVIDGTAGTPEAEIERIFTQWDENENREALTAGEKAAAVAALFEYGADGGTVSRRTGLDRSAIAAARKLAASETARTLAAQYPLTLDQAAVIAEFDDDPEIAAELAEFARDEPAQFEHAAQQAREERAEAAMIAARAAELAELGITVADRSPGYEKQISYLSGEDGKPLTEENHKDCPGSVAVLQVVGYGDNEHVTETWYCTDPHKYRHVKRVSHGTAPERSREEAAAERRRVIANNKDWRAATTVRQRWIRDVLIARKATVPDGAFLFIARAIAAADNHLIHAFSTMSGARALLGGVAKETYDYKTQVTTSPLLDSLAGASEARAQLVTLALIVGAHEDQAADVDTWRRPTATVRDYLITLAGWGYTPSPIEQALIDGTAYNADPTAGEDRSDG